MAAPWQYTLLHEPVAGLYVGVKPPVVARALQLKLVLPDMCAALFSVTAPWQSAQLKTPERLSVLVRWEVWAPTLASVFAVTLVGNEVL
jgi:hypothetical protein